MHRVRQAGARRGTSRPVAYNPAMSGDPTSGNPIPPDANRLIRWIMVAVLVWGVILAIGAWRLNNDPRRLLVVLACVIAFLGFWGAMLAARSRRLRHRD